MTERLPFGEPGPIAQVREGMEVVDPGGQKVGKVGDVHMGDPEAVTAEGEEPQREGGVIGAVAAAITGEGRLPRQAQEELARLGYLRIDRHHLGGRHLYASGDQVQGVVDGVVHLSVPEADLLR
ncbi:hypothetical protein ACGIF2_02515 [Cellulomonas sp. P22]|uniref:hypothetical protein n=1 Tax=Cellulomonas sp. P22 TaxID=3373189 RepID=UPI00378EA75A